MIIFKYPGLGCWLNISCLQQRINKICCFYQRIKNILNSLTICLMQIQELAGGAHYATALKIIDIISLGIPTIKYIHHSKTLKEFSDLLINPDFFAFFGFNIKPLLFTKRPLSTIYYAFIPIYKDLGLYKIIVMNIIKT